MITVITGKNHFLAGQKLSQLKASFIEQHGSSSVNEIDGEDATLEQVMQPLMSQGLFSSDSLVVLRDVAKNKYLQEGLLDKLEQVPSDAHLVIYDSNLDRRSTFFKTLRKDTEFVDCVEMDERDMVQWARDEFAELGGELGFAEAQFLVQRLNNDQWLLYNELQKLSSVEEPITKALIEEMVEESFNESIFNLLDRAFAKQANQALGSYRQMLANRVEPHYVFSMLVWQLHILLVVAYGGDRSPETIAKDNKLSPFVVKKSAGLVRKTSLTELRSIVARAVEVDIDSKTKAAYDMESAVDALIARIAS